MCGGAVDRMSCHSVGGCADQLDRHVAYGMLRDAESNTLKHTHTHAVNAYVTHSHTRTEQVQVAVLV
jgi:hypothetical protein